MLLWVVCALHVVAGVAEWAAGAWLAWLLQAVMAWGWVLLLEGWRVCTDVGRGGGGDAGWRGSGECVTGVAGAEEG